jgi:hypothetical protein
MPYRVPSSEESLRFVETNGVVLESAHNRVPTFVDFVAGERVTRWWGHSLSHSIFRLTRVVRDSPDVLTCRLVDHKVTYVHRRVWPALVRLSGKLNKADLASIHEEHLPNGKHWVSTIAFPRWAPAEVIEESKGLSERDAELLIGLGELGRTNGEER